MRCLRRAAHLVCLVIGLPLCAQLPPVTQGGGYAVYESITRGDRFFVAFDTATEMVLFRIPVHGTAWYSSNRQDPVAFNPGESAVREGDDRSSPPEIFSLAEYFPALTAHILAQADPDDLSVRRLDDGGWEVDTPTAFSSLWGYHRDPDSPRLQNNVVPATFVFDADGILRATHSGLQGEETETLTEYHDDVEHPRLAPKLVHPEHWQIVEAKTWVDEVPDEIADLESVLEFAKTHAFAEAEAFRTNLEASLASEEGKRDLERSDRKMLEPMNESSPRRWALPIVFVGVVFLGIGGFAWWKQR